MAALVLALCRVTLVSVPLARTWGTRLYWYRTLTTDGRDSDLVMLGLGYAF